MIPFRAGRRSCPGASMAIANIEIVLLYLVHYFNWKCEGELDIKESFESPFPEKCIYMLDINMIPFRAGRRSCPGASMAIANMEIVLLYLIHYFNWKCEGELDIKESFESPFPEKCIYMLFQLGG
ncbi:hypothetical protein SUGI_1021270 [Cryptomeria japonica]|nr:hypothetical protein SUGI_1021270 [Cryptomeria japonica]